MVLYQNNIPLMLIFLILKTCPCERIQNERRIVELILITLSGCSNEFQGPIGYLSHPEIPHELLIYYHAKFYPYESYSYLTSSAFKLLKIN